MKRKSFLASLAFIGAVYVLNAGVTVTVPDICEFENIRYLYAPIEQYAKASSLEERGIRMDSVTLINSKAVLNIQEMTAPYLVGLDLGEQFVMFYTTPSEEINIDVTSCEPLAYSIGGSELTDGLNELNIVSAPVLMKLQQVDDNNAAEIEQLEAQYAQVQKDFISANPSGAAAPVALLNLEGQDFIDVFETMPETLKSSIVYPMVEAQYNHAQRQVEMAKKTEALQSGETNAPGFTLMDLEGKETSLDDFRGKWVILDFWGSWCPWCIKGFPELKEAYEKYAGKLEIIGIDCRESEEQWKAGVEKYQLPWVNVYNPEDSNLLSEYGIQGFPTKVIISPDGNIKNITIGHNPEFFTILSQLIEN